MNDPRTDATDPAKIPSRTGLALVLFIIVIALATAIGYWVYNRAHPAISKIHSTPPDAIRLQSGLII